MRNLPKCGLWLLACSILENLSNISSEIDHPNKSKFSLILFSIVLLGSILWPIWSPHRRAVCAGDFPSSLATVSITGLFRTSAFTHVVPGEPNGEYPCLNQNSQVCINKKFWFLLWLGHVWCFSNLLTGVSLWTCRTHVAYVVAMKDDIPPGLQRDEHEQPPRDLRVSL